jgi:hypothetical protein
MTPEPADEKAEVELWKALIQAQESYAQSLTSLDTLVFDNTDSRLLPTERSRLQEAAQIRMEAYTRYRQAMDNLSASFRRH